MHRRPIAGTRRAPLLACTPAVRRGCSSSCSARRRRPSVAAPAWSSAANGLRSPSGTNCGRHVPSTLITPARRPRCSGSTSYAMVMARLRLPVQSASRRGPSLSSMLGQNGWYHTRRFSTRFNRSRTPTRSGRASTLRWPSARGPYSMPPWNQSTMRPDASRSATRPAGSATRVGSNPASRIALRIASSSYAGPSPRSVEVEADRRTETGSRSRPRPRPAARHRPCAGTHRRPRCRASAARAGRLHVRDDAAS